MHILYYILKRFEIIIQEVLIYLILFCFRLLNTEIVVTKVTAAVK